MSIHTFEAKTYIERRKILIENLESKTILFLGNRESSVNFKDNWYPFRQDSTFLYYFGLNVPNIDVVINTSNGNVTLFGDELTIDDIIWTGTLPSLKELAEKVGITDVQPANKLQSTLNNHTLFLPPYRPEHEIRLSELLQKDIEFIRTRSSIELIEQVVSQRNFKSKEEVKTLHDACTLTSKMHFEVMSKAKLGMHEFDLVSIAQSFRGKHDVNFSFLPICTTQGHVLHNHSYVNKLNKGDMVLLDAGLESNLLYAGDMTRTFPVERKFTAIQADLYQIVLNAQKEAIKASRIGNSFVDVHLKSAETTVQGLIDIGIMKGNAQEAVHAGAHTMFFQCGLGHLMGLDVHDMENLGEQYVGYGNSMVKSKEFGLKSLRLGRKLEEGFVITIEPGIYIIPQLIDKFYSEQKYFDFINYNELNKFRNFGGIRIEDDYLIKSSGIELLGEPLAKEIKDIEAIRSNIS